MKQIRKYLVVLLAVGLFLSPLQVDVLQASEKDSIRIMIDGQELESDVAPRIINNRTMVPFRAIFEALGAEVYWDNDSQTVLGVLDDTTIRLEVNQYVATVNNAMHYLDVPPMIVNERTLVPVRFVAESLGATVNWIGENRTVEIITNKTIVNSATGASLDLGMTEAELIQSLGEPQRKDLSEYGFYWYIYKKDYSNYIQVGVKNSKVVAFSVFSENWVIDEISEVRVGKTKSELPSSILTANPSVKLYFDNSVERLLAFEYIPEGLKSSPSYSDQVLRGWEKQILDQANALRAGMGLAPFSWSDLASASSRKHSKDMAINNYFSHKSLSGRTAWERMADEGISAQAQAENIAAGYFSSTAVTFAWWNSPDHRKNMVGNYTYLGVGIYYYEQSRYDTYFTEDFYTPK